MDMIYQSKMNLIVDAKKIIFSYYKVNVQYAISIVPGRIVGELFKIHIEGIEYFNKIITIDETLQYFTIVNIKDNSKTLLLNEDTGIYYNGFEEACLSLGKAYSLDHFRRMLRGLFPNKTSIKIV